MDARKITNALLGAAAASAVLMSFTACGGQSNAELETDLKNESVLRQLNERYGEDFEIAKTYYSGGYNALCRSVEHPEVIFSVFMPDTEIYSENYTLQCVSRRIQDSCSAKLSEVCEDSCCASLPYRVIMTDENICAGYDEASPYEGFAEMEYIIIVYLPVDGTYDGKEMYHTLTELTETAGYTSATLEICFVNDSDMYLVKKYYDNSLLMSSAPYNIPSGAGFALIDGEFNSSEDEYAELFAEKQEHAQNMYNTLKRLN